MNKFYFAIAHHKMHVGGWRILHTMTLTPHDGKFKLPGGTSTIVFASNTQSFPRLAHQVCGNIVRSWILTVDIVVVASLVQADTLPGRIFTLACILEHTRLDAWMIKC